LGEGLLYIDGVFNWVLMGRLLKPLLSRALIPIHKSKSLVIKSLPKAPNLKTITMGVRFQNKNWRCAQTLRS
jgi:hypothetical protein